MKEGFNIKSSLKIPFDSKKVAQKITEILSPDNVCMPEGLKVDIKCDNNYLKIDIYCKNGTGTFLNTLNELIEHISLSKIVKSND
jgi:transcription factor Pcc1